MMAPFEYGMRTLASPAADCPAATMAPFEYGTRTLASPAANRWSLSPDGCRLALAGIHRVRFCRRDFRGSEVWVEPRGAQAAIRSWCSGVRGAAAGTDGRWSRRGGRLPRTMGGAAMVRRWCGRSGGERHAA